MRTLEHHEHAEVKTYGKGNGEGQEQSSYVRLKCNKAKVQHLLLKYKIVRQKINDKAKQGITTAAGCVMIGLQGHDAPDQRVKDIQKGKDEPAYFIMNPSHESCENRRYFVSLRIQFVKDG